MRTIDSVANVSIHADEFLNDRAVNMRRFLALRRVGLFPVSGAFARHVHAPHMRRAACVVTNDVLVYLQFPSLSYRRGRLRVSPHSRHVVHMVRTLYNLALLPQPHRRHDLGAGRVLKLDRRVVNPTSLADICQEDPVVYTPIDMIEMLDMIHEGNRTVGGLSMTAKGYGIVGFVRFLDCYYLNFITQRRLVSRKQQRKSYGVTARLSCLCQPFVCV